MRRRILALAVTGLVIYGVAPAVLDVLGAYKKLGDIEPGWWIAVVLAQAAGLFCMWVVQAISMSTHKFRAVATSQLASGALGRVIPGGAATAAALQYRMLLQAGIPSGTAATGLAAGSLILIVALAGLPLVVLPLTFVGLHVPEKLWQTSLLIAGLFVALAAVGCVLLLSDRAVRLIGRVLAWLARLIRRPAEGDVPARLLAQRETVKTTLGRRWPEAVAAAAGRWIFDFLTLVAALEAVSSGASLPLVLLAYVIAQLLAQVPITPGGLGVVEAGMTGTLALAGVGAGAAAVATLAYRLASYWLQLPAGAVAYVIHRRAFVEGGSPA